MSSPSPAAGQANMTARQKHRGRLLQYYGINSQKKKDDPLDVNSEAFASDAYLTLLMSHKGLRGIMNHQCDLVTEIKELDGEMKTLVYENYEKFISATDTIKNMKNSIDGMEKEMNKLTENITRISEKSTGISRAFAEKRNKIKELGSRHSLLKRLQFIFELPNRLKISLNKMQYVQAVRFFYRTEPLFENYRDVAVFGSLETECINIMKDVTRRIKGRMRSDISTLSEISESAGLLLALKEPFKEISKEFIKLASNRLRKIKSEALNYVPELSIKPKEKSILDDGEDSKSHSQDITDVDNPAVHKMRFLNQTFLKEFSLFLDTYYAMFLSERPVKKNEPIKPEVKSSQRSNIIFSKDIQTFVIYLTPEERKGAKRDIDECIRVIVHEFFTTIEGFLKLPDAKSISSLELPVDVYTAVLELLFRDIHIAASNSQIIRTMLLPMSTNLIGVFLNTIIRDLFKLMKRDVMERIYAYENEAESEKASILLLNVVEDLSSWLTKDAIPRCIQDFKLLTCANASFMKNYMTIFQEAIRAELYNFWIFSMDEMVSVASSEKFYNSLTKPPSQKNHATVTLLIMSRFCQEVHEHVAYDVFTQFMEEQRIWPYDGMMTDPTSFRGASAHPIDPTSRSEFKDTVQKARTVSVKMLTKFVETSGNELAVGVRTYMKLKKWTADEEVTSVSSVLVECEKHLNRIDKEVGNLYSKSTNDNQIHHRDDSDSTKTSSNSAQQASTSNSIGQIFPSERTSASGLHPRRAMNLSSGSANNATIVESPTHSTDFMRSLDKLFSDRIEVFGKIQPENRNGIMAGLGKILLKSFTETVRELTFSRHGGQQVQVDIEFIRMHFWRYMSEERVLVVMLEELTNSAMKRCMDPVALENRVIEKILWQAQVN